MATTASKQVKSIPKGSTAKRATAPKAESASKRKATSAKARTRANADKVAVIKANDAAAAETIAKVTVRADDVALAKTKAERIRLAKEEQKALGAWQAILPESERGPKPPTPNLDALNGDTPPAKAKAAKAAPEATDTPSRAALARAEAKKGAKRGPGRPITEEELEAWIRAEVAADPTLKRGQAEQISYWIERFACGIDRFNNAWDRVVSK